MYSHAFDRDFSPTTTNNADFRRGGEEKKKKRWSSYDPEVTISLIHGDFGDYNL